MDNELKKEIILDNYKYPFNKDGKDSMNYEKINGIKRAKNIDNNNGIVKQLTIFLPIKNNFLFIASNPYDYEKIDNYSS